MTVADPEFLFVDDVLLLHEEQLVRYGGGDGLRVAGSLESAVATPQATFDGAFVHEDVYAMAAAYAFHIAQNQPFIDGNKRAGLAAALVFLDLNAIEIADPTGRLYEAMIGIAEKTLDKPGLAQLLRDLSASVTDSPQG